VTGLPASETWFDREEECAALEGLLDGVRSGRSGTVVVRGEAGIGKTRLLEYAVAAARDVRVERISAVESEMELAFAGLHQLIAPILAEVPSLPEPQQRALDTAFGLVARGAPERFFVGLATLTLLSEVARVRPLVCIIDDAQWLDEVSAEVLAFVARRLDADPVGLVFAVREPVGGRSLFEGLPELHLGGLPPEHAHRLLDSVVQAPLSPAVAERLVADTGGNPLALVELGGDPGEQDLAARLLPGDAVLAQPWRLGRRLEEQFLRRVRTLPADTQDLLVVVAAEPTGDPRLLWAAAEQLGIDPSALDAAEAEGLVVNGATVTFVHPLVRSAVYQGASSTERRYAHAALAAVSNLDRDRRAWHLSLSVVGADEEVAAELERAAERATARGGYAASAALFGRAAALTPDPATQAVRRLVAAEAALLAGQPDQASVLLDEAMPCLEDPLARAQATRWQGKVHFALGQPARALPVLLAAARAFQPIDPRQAREALLSAFEAASYAGWTATRARLEEIASLARALPRDPEAESSATDLLLDGWAAQIAIGYPAAVPLLRRAIAKLLADDLDPEEGLLRLALGCLAAYELFDDQAQHRLALRCVQLARATGALMTLATALFFLAGVVETDAGRFEAARAGFAEGREISAATGNPGIAGVANVVELYERAWRGHESEARLLAAAVAEESKATGRNSQWIYSRECLAVLELGLGNYQAALQNAVPVYEDDAPDMGTTVLPDLIEAAARCGEHELAAVALERLSERALATGTPLALGLLARSGALLAADQDAGRLYEDSIEHLQQCRTAPQLARAHLLYGEWLRRQRRRRHARQQLRTAHDMLADIGAEAFAARARRELNATGEHARKRSVDTTSDLTPQETHIARLASEGHTKRDIASQLFISPSTVDYHLRKVYTKLGVTNRTSLHRILAQRDPS
jgi:DNA-binding CsgD family transcriptional regulator